MTFVVGVAGGSGSGKTFLARALADVLGERCLTLAHDAYYRPLPPAARVDPDAWNFDAPDALESALLVAHLDALRAGGAVDVPVYAFEGHDRVGVARQAPRPVVLVEGILLLAVPELARALDLRVFVDAPEDVRLARRLTRDVRDRGRDAVSVRERFDRWVRPMHALHVAPSRAAADLTLDGEAPVADNVRAVLARLPPAAR